MHDPIDILRDLVKAYDRSPDDDLESLCHRIEDARKLVAQFDDSKAPDGRVRKMTPEDIEPGVVVRMLNWDGSAAAFSDTVILREENGYVKLARPHGMVGCAETTSPSPYTGVENYSVSVESLLSRFHVVLQSTGKVAKRTT